MTYYCNVAHVTRYARTATYLDLAYGHVDHLAVPIRPEVGVYPVHPAPTLVPHQHIGPDLPPERGR